jgi:DNA-binding IclR family transcriptional regulator
MLAHLPDAQARLKRTSARLKRSTRFDVDALMRELETVRSRGYSVSNFVEGVTSIGAALIAHNGLPVAALSVSAPNDRLNGVKRKLLIERLLHTCASMSDRVRL